MRRWQARRLVRHAFYRLCKHLAIPAMMVFSRVRHFDVPEGEGLKGGVIIASNHQSFFDPVLVGMALSRPINYLARSSLFSIPLFSWLIRALGAHPLRMGRVDVAAIKGIRKLLSSGEILLVFPEGTRTHDGSLGPFKSGVGSIASRCAVPILPVCIEGAFECWPRQRVLPRPGRTAVAFGDLIRPEGETGDVMTRNTAAQIRRMRRSLKRYLHEGSGDRM